jgi:3-isopropylmalate dehydrogenase
MTAKVILLPGDGIGPEIAAPAVQVLDAVAPGALEYEEHLFGGASIDVHGTALTDETLQACRAADAVLLAAVGGPKWDTTDPAKPRPEQGLLGLRKGLGLFANLRPVRPLPALYDASPLKLSVIERTDLLVVRELTGGIYFGEKTRDSDSASDACVYTRAEIERIARVAFRAARSRVTSVDKANVLETSRLWREVVREIHGREFPNIELEHLLVDNAAMRLVAAPRHFEVILTENMFGDILSDEAAMLTGSIGLLPSASLGNSDPPTPGLFEPVHGSAPDIAGTGQANPLAMFLSAALMLRHGLGMEGAAAAVESAVDRALADGLRTPDLGGAASTAEATQAVLKHL